MSFFAIPGLYPLPVIEVLAQHVVVGTSQPLIGYFQPGDPIAKNGNLGSTNIRSPRPSALVTDGNFA